MNRQKRRAMTAKIRKGEIVQTHWLGIDCVDPALGLKIGDNTKIPGKKIVNGHLVNCRPGDETIFTLRYEGNQKRWLKKNTPKSFIKKLLEKIHARFKSIISSQ